MATIDSNMASRFESIPEDFLVHLSESVPGFKAEQSQHQFELARMAWIGLNKHNKHSHDQSAMTFHYSDLDKVFGRSKFQQVNARLNFFNRTAGWSKVEKYTRGYYFSSQVQKSVDSYLALSPWDRTTRLLMADGKVLKTIPAGVSSKDMSGLTTRAWVNAKSLNQVKVDMDELVKLKTSLVNACTDWRASAPTADASDNPRVARYERVIETISKVCRMAMTDVGGESYVAHHYREAQSGRLYPQGISLASAQTVVKDAALSGNWEYDIANCHYAILEQMAKHFGCDCSAILDYLKFKEETRIEIAEQADITLLQAKTCLVALMYGARASTWHENAIPLEIGTEAAARLYASPTFIALQSDIGNAKDVILSKSARSSKGWLKNAFGKATDVVNKAQQMAHLLQGVEAKALQAVINAHPNDIVLVQHDGFVSSKKLDVCALSNAIRSATGYELALKESLLKADPIDYFAGR